MAGTGLTVGVTVKEVATARGVWQNCRVLHSDTIGLVFEVERTVSEGGQIEDDRRRQDRVATQEVDLDLHRVAEPAEDVDVVPAFLVVAARWVVVDADDVVEVLV